MLAIKFHIPKLLYGMFVLWGGLSLLGAAIIAGVAVYAFGFGGRTKDDMASVHDVRFVLNWCGLGDQRIEKVVHSHVSPRSFNGDYLEAYAIKVSHLELTELTVTSDHLHIGWYRGDQLPKILGDAVTLVGGWLHGHEIPWFPTEAELRSMDIYVYPWSINCHGIEPTAEQIIFVRPSDRMVFYLGCKI